MSLSVFQVRSTCAGADLMKALRKESTVAPEARIAALLTRMVPPAVTSPELPWSRRRLVSEFTRTCASLNCCFGTSKVTATAENGEARSVPQAQSRSEEHTSELQSQSNIVCRLLLDKT